MPLFSMIECDHLDPFLNFSWSRQFHSYSYSAETSNTYNYPSFCSVSAPSLNLTQPTNHILHVPIYLFIQSIWFHTQNNKNGSIVHSLIFHCSHIHLHWTRLVVVFNSQKDCFLTKTQVFFSWNIIKFAIFRSPIC